MTLPPPECRVFTPAPLAAAMVHAIEPSPLDLWLDPCIGPGAFVACLRTRGVQKERIFGIDIDPSSGAEDASATTVRGVDFFKWCASTKQMFNRIVANPPYVAIRKLAPTLQQSVKALAADDNDRSFAPRSNYWCAFLSASLRLLADQGSLAFVLPAAWDYAHYAADVKRAIHENFQSVEVHRSREPLFSGVREGCVVLVAKGFKKPPANSLRINHGSGQALIDALVSGKNKPSSPRKAFGKATSSRCKFSDLFAVKIGCVTGDAKFFLLRESDRIRFELPRESLTPVLSKARHLKSAYVTSADWQSLLDADERVWLFNPPQTLMEEKAVHAYLQHGLGVCDLKGYKLRHRDPWHCVPDLRYEAAGFISGMTKLGPWICFRSKRGLVATNTLYTLTPKTRMTKEEQAAWALALLSSSPRRQFHAIARRYPDGLAKLEPHDLNSIRLPAPVRTKGAREQYAHAINHLVAGRITEAVKIGNTFADRG